MIALARATLAPTPAASQAATPPGQRVDVQLLAINDFHGNLEPPGGPIAGVPARGAEYLATHIRQLEATNRNTLVVSAGDLIGASPLLSAPFHDEPTIEAKNLIGLDLNAVGNHEFDEGITECCAWPRGAVTRWTAAWTGTGSGGRVRVPGRQRRVVPQWQSRSSRPMRSATSRGAEVAFIAWPSRGRPASSPRREWRARVPARGRHGQRPSPRVAGQGAGEHRPPARGRLQTGGYNDCRGIAGPVVDIVDRFSDAVDIVVSGHTHQAYNCVIDGKVVTSASSFGRVVTDIDFTVDKPRGDVVEVRANNFIVTRTVEKAGDVTGLIAKY